MVIFRIIKVNEILDFLVPQRGGAEKRRRGNSPETELN